MNCAPSSVSRNAGAFSTNVVLMPGPRFTGVCQPKSSWTKGRHDAQMSKPNPPARELPKNIQWPSRERFGTRSAAAVLMVAPTLTGVPHGSVALARCETQMSSPPNPGRVDVKYRLRPSFDRPGPESSKLELIVAPRLVAADHSE